ncbi:hypothetical protein CK203_021995 [Vitis vinifera]|uniref:Reverse transcriptase zinc-binding domain-containing protein n=1 Tax=Vitis vinifera TaxID=29760 RepID=A0A438JFX5_VITVI|nr:hypothetical protein CK203_021995 [Vitis vinifera]
MRGCPILFPSFMRWRSTRMQRLMRCGIIAVVQGLQAIFRGGRGALEKGGHGKYGVKEAYNGLVVTNACDFPYKSVWVNKVPTKVAFFAWEAAWGKILTLDRLQKRGWQFPNRCFLCGCEEESVNHILLHCIVVRALWDIVFALVGVQWVFPELVKEALFSWRGPFVGKKRKKIWNSIPLCIFWTVWKERNRTQTGLSLHILQQAATRFEAFAPSNMSTKLNDLIAAQSRQAMKPQGSIDEMRTLRQVSYKARKNKNGCIKESLKVAVMSGIIGGNLG